MANSPTYLLGVQNAPQDLISLTCFFLQTSQSARAAGASRRGDAAGSADAHDLGPSLRALVQQKKRTYVLNCAGDAEREGIVGDRGSWRELDGARPAGS